MSDPGVLLPSFGVTASRNPGRSRGPWPLRVLPGLAACGLAGLLIAGFLDQRGTLPPAPLADSVWVDGGAPLYGLEVAGFIRATRAEAWLRRLGPGRHDVLTFGDGPGSGDWLRLSVLQAGPLDPVPGSFYLDLTRAAARAGVAVTRAALPDLLVTRFGGFEVADVELAQGEGGRVCLGFRLLAGDPDLRILGFACGREGQLARRALACTLDSLQLLAPGADADLARYFAVAQLAPRSGCDARPPGIRSASRP